MENLSTYIIFSNTIWVIVRNVFGLWCILLLVWPWHSIDIVPNNIYNNALRQFWKCESETKVDKYYSNHRDKVPREDAGGLSREYVLRIPSVS